MPALIDLPTTAAWAHVDARTGFEVAFFQHLGAGWRLEGATAAVEDGEAWVVRYRIEVDERWVTRRAEVTSQSALGVRHARLEADGAGRWLVGGDRAPALDGCLDVDLEASAMTNLLPERRLALEVGERAGAPAAYVRALDLEVEPLPQEYVRLPDAGRHRRYRYSCPTFALACDLEVDAAGLVVSYPGIARRVR
ncbi:putative glycolipid-binding domain-containing protein [Georgenia sp. AZ-5]|uniref:putative glycolipid-binding domain-containing protein n=1 Tax=Georgenia sp. AZ-5 TaxID=3367526 RepID=UPI0037551F7F